MAIRTDNTSEVTYQKINKGVIFCCNNRIPLFLFELVCLTITELYPPCSLVVLDVAKLFYNYYAIKCSVPFFSS